MIRATPFGSPAALGQRTLPIVGAFLAGLGLVAAFGLIVANVVVALWPGGVSLSVADGTADVPLGAEFRTNLAGWGARVERATLIETARGPDGAFAAPREVGVRTVLVRHGWEPDLTEATLAPASGSLRPDASYRLIVRGSALAPALPWPQPVEFEREARFSTLASPRPLPAPETRLAWGQPMKIAWSAPIESFQVEVTPPTAASNWVDPADSRTSFVQLEDPGDAATYAVAVVEAKGANGVTLQQPASYSLVAPPRPKLVEPERERTLELGSPLTLSWSQPMERLAVTSEPALPSSWEIDSRNPAVTRIKLDDMAQGTTYQLTIPEAVAKGGTPLAGPQTFTVNVPAALAIERFDTGSDAARDSVKTRPTLVFSEPIRDRRAVQAAIATEPQMQGRFEWLDDRRVQFVPLRDWPYDEKITFRVRGGPDGPRSQQGGYLEEPAQFSFITEPDKVIDVNVTRQVMTLMRGGRAEHTLPVATGVPGADTPLGEYFVQYKMPTARFRGTNVDGSRYDIADVKWVLAFLGDYTIHGAYWRSAFGRPGSNGCVSLTDANAKLVYDWAPEGTRVNIHY
jgi:lipoprotein-anchoring transpeptidase ErfK/SrfK